MSTYTFGDLERQYGPEQAFKMIQQYRDAGDEVIVDAEDIVRHNGERAFELMGQLKNKGYQIRVRPETVQKFNPDNYQTLLPKMREQGFMINEPKQITSPDIETSSGLTGMMNYRKNREQQLKQTIMDPDKSWLERGAAAVRMGLNSFGINDALYAGRFAEKQWTKHAETSRNWYNQLEGRVGQMLASPVAAMDKILDPILLSEAVTAQDPASIYKEWKEGRYQTRQDVVNAVVQRSKPAAKIYNYMANVVFAPAVLTFGAADEAWRTGYELMTGDTAVDESTGELKKWASPVQLLTNGALASFNQGMKRVLKEEVGITDDDFVNDVTGLTNLAILDGMFRGIKTGARQFKLNRAEAYKQAQMKGGLEEVTRIEQEVQRIDQLIGNVEKIESEMDSRPVSEQVAEVRKMVDQFSPENSPLGNDIPIQEPDVAATQTRNQMERMSSAVTRDIPPQMNEPQTRNQLSESPYGRKGQIDYEPKLPEHIKDPDNRLTPEDIKRLDEIENSNAPIDEKNRLQLGVLQDKYPTEVQKTLAGKKGIDSFQDIEKSDVFDPGIRTQMETAEPEPYSIRKAEVQAEKDIPIKTSDDLAKVPKPMTFKAKSAENLPQRKTMTSPTEDNVVEALKNRAAQERALGNAKVAKMWDRAAETVETKEVNLDFRSQNEIINIPNMTGEIGQYVNEIIAMNPDQRSAHLAQQSMETQNLRALQEPTVGRQAAIDQVKAKIQENSAKALEVESRLREIARAKGVERYLDVGELDALGRALKGDNQAFNDIVALKRLTKELRRDRSDLELLEGGRDVMDWINQEYGDKLVDPDTFVNDGPHKKYAMANTENTSRIRNKQNKRGQQIRISGFSNIQDAMNALADRTGLPFDVITDWAVRGLDIAEQAVRGVRRAMDDAGLNWKEYRRNFAADERVWWYTREGGWENVPQEVKMRLGDITTQEAAFADWAASKYKQYETLVKMERLQRYIRDGELPPDAGPELMNTGKALFQRAQRTKLPADIQAFEDWVRTTKYGVRDKYVPMSSDIAPNANGFFEVDSDKWYIPEGRGFTKTRTGESGYDPRQPFVASLENYIRRAERIIHAEPHLKNMELLIRDSMRTHNVNPGNIDWWFLGVRNMQPVSTGPIIRAMERLIGQFYRVRITQRLPNWFIRNIAQTSAMTLPAMIDYKHPVQSLKNAYRLTSGIRGRWNEFSKRNPDAAKYFDTYIAQMGTEVRHYMPRLESASLLNMPSTNEGGWMSRIISENLGFGTAENPSAFRQRMRDIDLRLMDFNNIYSMSDLINRKGSYIAGYEAAREGINKYQRNPTEKNIRNLFETTGLRNMPNYVQNRVLKYLDRGEYDQAAMYAAGKLTDYTQFLYQRYKRGSLYGYKPGGMASLVTPIATFWKGSVQFIMNQGVYEVVKGVGQSLNSKSSVARRKGLNRAMGGAQKIAAWWAMAALINSAKEQLMGDDNESYGIKQLVGMIPFSGPAHQAVMGSVQAMSDLITAVASSPTEFSDEEKREAKGALGVMVRTIDYTGENWVPFYYQINNLIELTSGRTNSGIADEAYSFMLKNIDAEAYNARMSTKKFVDYRTLQWVQKILFGGGKPTDYEDILPLLEKLRSQKTTDDWMRVRAEIDDSDALHMRPVVHKKKDIQRSLQNIDEIYPQWVDKLSKRKNEKNLIR